MEDAADKVKNLWGFRVGDIVSVCYIDSIYFVDFTLEAVIATVEILGLDDYHFWGIDKYNKPYWSEKNISNGIRLVSRPSLAFKVGDLVRYVGHYECGQIVVINPKDSLFPYLVEYRESVEYGYEPWFPREHSTETRKLWCAESSLEEAYETEE